MTTNNGNAHLYRNVLTEDRRPAQTQPEPQKKRGFPWFYVIVFLIVLAVIVVFVLWLRSRSQSQLKSNTTQMAVETVSTISPQKGSTETHLVLPGTVEALTESSVYAQVSGYVKDWKHDIGSTVKQGDLLAEIDTPVTDQQLKQSEESVKQAEANLGLAKVTAARYNALFVSRAVSQQDVDNQNASVKVQEANLSAAQAFEGGIQKTEAFKQVRAPFDGTITARRIDVGDFVSATGQTASTATSGSGPLQTGTPNQELFRIAQTATLRIYINVPEQYAGAIVPGNTALVEFASTPGQKVPGNVVRTAKAIDPSSLTLLTEVDVSNADGKLLSGGYAQVHLDFTDSNPPLTIPGNCLIFRQHGPQVGIVDDSNTVHLQTITIVQDQGTKLEISGGVKESDRVVINPSDSLEDGQKVQVKAPDAPKKQ